MFYFDNAATTKPRKQIIDYVTKQMQTLFANPSSMHSLGIKSYLLLEEQRELLANIYGIQPRGVVFCSSGTESDNLAMKGVMQQYSQGNLIISPLEHAAVLESAQFLKKQGFEIRLVQISKKTGQVDLEHLSSLLDKNTRLVSIQHVNNETGIIQNLKAIHKKIKQADTRALFHSDGVQACGKIEANLTDLGVDFYSISSHKIHSIRGAGALLMLTKREIMPLIHGGNQEYGLRSGTENILAISAMVQALTYSLQEREESWTKVNAFRSKLLEELTKLFPTIESICNDNQIPHILSLRIPPVDGEVLLHHLEKEKIYVSTGSACHAKSIDLSLGLSHLGLNEKQIKQTIRLSFSLPTLPLIQETPYIASVFYRQYSQIIE